MNTPSDTGRLDAALVLAVVIIIGGVLASLVFIQIPQANMTLFASLATGLMSLVLGAYAGYRWGASKGSAAKDETISKLAGGTQ